MSFICDICKNTFSTNSSLLSHKKTAKYCLELQSSIVDDFKCEYCDKSFNIKNNLLRHYNTCKKKEFELNHKNEIDKIKKQYEDIIDKIKKKYEYEIDKIKKEKDNGINDIKEKYEQQIKKIEKESNSLEIENKMLKKLLNEEKNRVNDLFSKSKGNTTNIQNNINGKFKDNFEELFEKLPKFTKENLLESFKDVLNEDVLLEGIDYFSKVVNSCLGAYGIISDFARNKVVLKDKDGNRVNAFTPKVFVDSINNIQEITKEVLAKSREKVDTFNMMEQDIYINNLYPIKELILNCEREQTSDKNIMKYGKRLTDNCQVVTRINSTINSIESHVEES